MTLFGVATVIWRSSLLFSSLYCCTIDFVMLPAVLVISHSKLTYPSSLAFESEPLRMWPMIVAQFVLKGVFTFLG